MKSKKPKILFYVPLPPPVHGAAISSQSLVESKLINHAYDVIVVPFNFVKSIDDVGKFSFLKLYKFLSRIYELVSKMIFSRPEIVYFNFTVLGSAFYRDFCYTMIIKLFRPKLILHLRTQGVNDQAKKSKLKRWMYLNAFKDSHVICLSEFLSTDVREVYYHRPLIVNNGILDVYDRYPRYSNEGTPVILFLSNLSKSKGVLDLINAFSIMRSNDIPFIGVIAGPALDLSMEYLEKELLNKNVKDCVSLIGPQYGEAKYSLLSRSDIFVFPTYFEAFPGVVLEAMQFGLPVVGSIEGAIPEIIDNGITGLLVQKQDSVDLAEKITQLILDREFSKKLGSNARKKFISNYTRKHYEERMKWVFDEIAKE